MGIDVFFFFKQKTAYEMRISDWSSDVCSSDLINRKDLTTVRAGRFLNRAVDRLERNVRLPFMERLVEYTITDSPDIDLPTDFIELANLFVDDVELEQVDMRRFLKTSREGTTPDRKSTRLNSSH